MVEVDNVRPPAVAIARQFAVFLKRLGGQAQFSAALVLQESDGTFERLHARIASHLDCDLSLGMPADQASMSLLSFSRRYRQSTGRAPANGLDTIGFESARQLLENGASVTRMASR